MRRSSLCKDYVFNCEGGMCQTNGGREGRIPHLLNLDPGRSCSHHMPYSRDSVSSLAALRAEALFGLHVR